ncbi:hypothetical protein PR048_026601 [Dryococelus australis]|uniref:PiggyBac transposable element-derived protein domain-containing protein n=1 Tax=Dryococelus australis TaxID=614101 RepID=A0ABQ9GLT7_9NEOP|nr:hypothetical protein PR048_026601 [Dryococelus australis]
MGLSLGQAVETRLASSRTISVSESWLTHNCVGGLLQFGASLSVQMGFTLHELLSILEDKEDSSDLEEVAVAIMPSTNANSNLKDEDSGDEENVTISNLLLHKFKLKHQLFPGGGTTAPKMSFIFPVKFKSTKNQVHAEVIDMLVDQTNRYAARKNKIGDVSDNEIKCFIDVLLLSGYVSVSRRRMFWEGSKDCYNELVANKAIALYFGCHGCKQFIIGKPIRYGHKLWIGATDKEYVVWMEPYQGAKSKISDKYKRVVLDYLLF